MRLVFDIECNGLYHDVTRMWVLVTHNLDTRETKYWLEGEEGWKEYLSQATTVIGHNILDYDIPVLKKLFNFELPEKCIKHDTLILSQILDYKRFPNGRHRLEDWGVYLEFPKITTSDGFFDQYSPEMLEYCINDVKLNVKVYNVLMTEYGSIYKKSPQIRNYIQAEHYLKEWCFQAEQHGWPFDINRALELHDKLQAELDYAHEMLSSKLGMKCVAVDKKKGVVEPKKPRWTKQGFYDQHTCNWFKIDPESGYEGEERLIEGPYSRVLFEPLDLDSVSDVKIFLYRHGWQPTDWNYKLNPDTGKKERTSAKITEDSLEFLGGDGKLYVDFLTARSRHSILKTWIENTDEKELLHGRCVPIGTPSMRARHEIIVNIPSADSPWGKEMRELFTCFPGWKLIGCDSSGNQARGLAHYLNNQDFINTLLHGDIHQYNADILTAVLKVIGIDHVVKRPQAKRILYAFLFGASGAKLWSYIFGTLDFSQGNQLKGGFLKAVPGFKELIDRLSKIYATTSKHGDGYIYSIVGTKLYVDSFHKLLVYLLQSLEKITCTTALMLIVKKLKEENIPYIPLIMYHDEIDFMVPEEYSERAAEIGKEAFRDGPKIYGIQIMDGESKIGNNWYEIH
jgi:DNA polymerase-1